MEKIIDGILTTVVAVLIAMGGKYTLEQTYIWARHKALEKAATGLGSLEKASRTLTGGKLDY